MKTYTHFSDAQLRAEIEKCQYCAEKPCLEACPAHCSPADFIMAAKLQTPGDYKRAALEILSKNPLGHTCGIVCPDTFCMAACSRNTFDRAVNIPGIQAAILEHARANGLTPPEPPSLNGKKIAVIGAGPAGLAAAATLAGQGYAIDLFDEERKPGGACLMIPDSRLPKKALARDIDFVLGLGAIKTCFRKKVENPAALTGRYEAVLVSVGEPEMSTLGIPGEKLAISSIEYLRNPNAFRGKKRVAIVGGGAVAADCAVTARLNGGEAVEVFVRRTVAEMPLTDFERKMLLEHTIDLTTRTRVLGIARCGRTLTLKTTKVEPVKTASGKVSLKDIAGTTVKRSGFDLVVLAIGTEWRGSKDRPKGLFFAGDCVNGASTVVQAVAAGKNAAREIDLFLRGADSAEKATFKKQARPGSRSEIKSRLDIPGVPKLDDCPVDLRTDFFGIPISSPFLLSAAPATDGFEQMKRAYEAGWAGGVMKTAFDNLPIHIPAGYMFTFGKTTHGNCDNVSGHPLDRVCREIAQLREQFPDRLTMGSTGGPVTGNDESDRRGWQSNTKKLERAGAMAIEYSLSCPQGGDGSEGAIVSQNAAVTAKVIDWVMQVSDPAVPKLFKLTAAVTSIKPIILAVKEVLLKYPGKKAGVTLANSFPVMGFRPGPSGKPWPNEKWPNKKWDEGVVVGMSGEGVVPISYLTLAEVSPFGVTVSGNGGVMDYRAGANFLALGARSVQVCTIATHYGVGIIRELNSGLSHLLQAYGLKSVQELIGIALPKPITPFDQLPAKKQLSAVNSKLCQSCGNCTRCPYMAITLDSSGHPETDPSRCVGCTICVKSCFAEALFMRDRTPAELSALKE